MHSELVVLLILVALALAYVSLLLAIRLGSLGVTSRQIRRMILYVWLTFALMIGVFSVLQHLLGPLPPGPFPENLFAQFARLRQLPVWQQFTVYGGFVALLAVFLQLLRSLHTTQQTALRAQSTDGESDESAL